MKESCKKLGYSVRFKGIEYIFLDVQKLESAMNIYKDCIQDFENFECYLNDNAFEIITLEPEVLIKSVLL